MHAFEPSIKPIISSIVNLSRAGEHITTYASVNWNAIENAEEIV